MKVALVTGARQGIGEALATELAAHDYTVYAGMRTPLSKGGLKLRPIELDVDDDASITAAMAQIKSEAGRLDVLINNAGVNKRSSGFSDAELSNLAELDRRALLKMMETNAISPMLVIQQALPLMAAGEQCFIVNISSDRASFHDELPNSSGNYGYRASKVALNMLTHCLLHDLPEQVATFAVHPGSVLTSMNPHGKLQPAESAAAIYSIMDAWKPEFNGAFLRYDGSLYPL